MEEYRTRGQLTGFTEFYHRFMVSELSFRVRLKMSALIKAEWSIREQKTSLNRVFSAFPTAIVDNIVVSTLNNSFSVLKMDFLSKRKS